MVGCGKNAGVPVNVHHTVVPGGNDFTGGVIRRRDIGVRAVKNGQALRLLLEVTPVRIRFGDVAPNDKLLPRLAYGEGCVSSERAVVCARDEDGERVCPHESDGVGVVMHTEMFGDVHE